MYIAINIDYKIFVVFIKIKLFIITFDIGIFDEYIIFLSPSINQISSNLITGFDS